MTASINTGIDMRRIAITIVTALLVSGCNALQPMPTNVVIAAPFDEAAAARSMLPGDNKIIGGGMIRRRDGILVTCAGNPVTLRPVNDYLREKMLAIYGSAVRGFNPAGVGRRNVMFLQEPLHVPKYVREALCNVDGHFQFDKVSDGDFYLETSVVWQLNPYFAEGGGIMQMVSVRGGEVKEVVLSP